MKPWLTYRRTNRRRYGIPPVLALYAHDDGSPVLKEDAVTLQQKALLICGVQLSVQSGTLTLQWRGFGKDGR